MKSSRILKGLPLGLLVFATLTNCTADGLLGCPVTLAWDASPDVNVTGYALYHGLETPPVTNRLDVGPLQSVTFTNLYANSNYFFFVVAYNSFGMESLPSGVVFYRPPAIAGLRILKHPNGTTVLRFRSAAGSRCRIEYSSTAYSDQWQTLTTRIADTAGYVTFTNVPGGPSASRFYRVARP